MRKPLFRRFHDLTPEAINVELQVHTEQTDGQASPAELLRKAEERGLRTVAFTEHVRRGTDWFPRFSQEVREAAVAHPALDVYVGCEAKALDTRGTFDADPELLDQCELILGSVHRFPDGKGGFLDFGTLTAPATARLECDLALGLIRDAPIDVLAHPGGMYQRRHGAYPLPLFREMILAVLEREVAIEISSSYLVDADGFLRLCEELNPLVSIGSDVHRPDELGACRDMLNDWFGW